MKPLDLYPKNHSADLDPDLFKNPTAEYRGTPFWSWNNKLNIPQLRHQIEVLRQMGFGGFHMHSRTGTATDYLGDEFMAAVKACAEKAEADKMLAWLYDEDRWPSGFAGGLVTSNPKYRAKFIRFTPQPKDGGNLLASYEIVLEGGRLASHRRLSPGEKAAMGVTWNVYLESEECSTWFNNQAYVDTLSKEAIGKFVEVTHKRYKEVIGKWFGGVVPAVFTDEPNFPHIDELRSPEDLKDVTLPFTDDFFETYAAEYGERLEERLPEVIWERLDGEASLARYRFHDHVAERFAAGFADTIGDWCEENGIALTGHLLEEATLRSQSAHVGECMRSYRSFQLPGIDMLCDWREYTTAKQAQSAAHQYGRPGVLSELYGVTGWHWDFLGHKGQGDWQAALGITVRVPHLSWVSMAGEAKRDYPASISYQSPWWREYPLVEDHFARVNTALTRGKPMVPVAVVHPVESYWLCYGPIEQTSAEREEREKAFSDIVNWLLFGLVDFDFVCESTLPVQSEAQQGASFSVGQMRYKAVVVPGMRTIRATTMDRLESFAASGGTVIFAGEVPSLVDAAPSDRPLRLASKCRAIPFTRTGLMSALDEFRDVEIRLADGRQADSIMYQMRDDGGKRRLFLCNTDRDFPRAGLTIKVRGLFGAQKMDTFTGEIVSLKASQENGWTVIDWDLEGAGSLLLTLTPGKPSVGEFASRKEWREIGRLEGPVPVTLSEPNVLLLDQAQYRVGDEPWSELEETLRLGNVIRKRFGLSEIGGSIAQPWTDKEPCKVVGTAQIRYLVESSIAVEGAMLAVEAPESLKVTLDGANVPYADSGYFVDEAIRCLPLPLFGPGSHELILEVPFHRKTELEWCYILGDFGVRVAGRKAMLTAPVKDLHFGDWVNQGLPFYAGNVTYHCMVAGGGRRAVHAPWFGAPLLSVALDGEVAGKAAFPPYRVDLGVLPTGSHRVEITAFGNRYNAFGSVHNCDPHLVWFGPGSWRRTGTAWSYEYQLKPMGVLVGPMVEE